MDFEWLVDFLKGMIQPVAAYCSGATGCFVVVFSETRIGGRDVRTIVAGSFYLTCSWSPLQVIQLVNALNMYLVGSMLPGASILSGTAVTMSLLVILNVFPFTPRYIIPVAGMMVGNAMTVTGVTMKRLRDDIKIQISLVETALALGATPRQATLQQVKRSLVIALSPVLDNAKTVGLISLPGAMTGMIMGGASPLEAIQLQIVVMNMLIGASTVSSILSTYLCWPAFFTKAYQLETKVFRSD
ncbi:aluminum sensitive 3 [Melia azedarach]|uniref:Aluminum sensitive 3 n=1 Tax=Melia azedarach TaxID=155640 RepID=A0ACC1X3S3_MELAZ|nr:aluminum sensitive 3 [Melia azedarach]